MRQGLDTSQQAPPLHTIGIFVVLFRKGGSMPLRTILVLLVLVGIAVFAMLNWEEFTRPTTLRLGLGTVEAPLGLIMLAITVLLLVLFLIFVTYLQTSVLLESRRHTRELQTQRQLAEQAEASRYSQLRQYLEAELPKLAAQQEQGHTRISERLDQMDRDLRQVIEQTGNTLAAYIGELEDRLQRQLSHDDQSKSA
jgi:DNA anti-recombination protein RmuC